MTRVLVPVAVLEGESVSPGLISLLGTVDVTVLGYHVLPEQTPPDQARLQFEERATSALEDISQEFRAAGGATDHRLVFTRDREQTMQRVAERSPDNGDVSSQGLVYLEQATETSVNLNREAATGVRGDTVNLAYLNMREILYPRPDYNLQIYSEIPKDLEDVIF